MKDYFEYQGNTRITGSRDATREAFKINLIENGEGWMEMIKSQNLSTHTYKEELAHELKESILNRDYSLFLSFKFKMQSFL